MITVETAKVYRGGRRRWFSMAAAVRAEAKELYRQRIKSKDRCDCEKGSYEGPGPHTCKYHSYDTDIRYWYYSPSCRNASFRSSQAWRRCSADCTLADLLRPCTPSTRSTERAADGPLAHEYPKPVTTAIR